MTIYIAISIILGFVLLFWVKNRKFRRINAYGVEEYKSLTGKIASTLFDKLVWILGVLLIVSESFLPSPPNQIYRFDITKFVGVNRQCQKL